MLSYLFESVTNQTVRINWKVNELDNFLFFILFFGWFVSQFFYSNLSNKKLVLTHFHIINGVDYMN